MLVRDSGPNESTIGIQTAPASANVAAHFFMPMPYLARRCNPAKGVGERYRDFSPTNTQCVFKEGDTITAINCPKCKLINPPTAERCDCGYDFATGTMEQSYLTERDRQLSKPLMTTTIALALLALRFAFLLARGAQRSPLAFVLTLLVLAGVACFWFFHSKAEAKVP